MIKYSHVLVICSAKNKITKRNLEINKCNWRPVCALHLQFQKSMVSDAKFYVKIKSNSTSTDFRNKKTPHMRISLPT